MAAGQRKYVTKEIRFAKDGADIRCDTEYSWGIEEADGQVKPEARRANTASFSKAELIALLTAPERQGLLDIFAKIQTAVKAKAAELTNAIEE